MNMKFRFNNKHSHDNQIMEFLQWVVGLYQLGQHNNNEGNIYNDILSHIVEGFDADTGSLAFLTQDGQYLHLVAGIDLPAGVVGSQVAVNESRMGSIVQSAAPTLFNDEPSARVSSAMCWPLTSQDQVLGALNINRGKDREAYTQADLDKGKVLIDLISVVLENTQLHKDYQVKIQQLESMNTEMKTVNHKLDSAKSQLLQSEKLASIGQLAAGVAHEINNPVGFINSNMGALNRYINDLFKLVEMYEQIENKVESTSALETLQKLKSDIDLVYLKDDIKELLEESQEGVGRVKQIVQDLKDFSHVNEAEWSWSDLHQGIDSTLNVARNEIKYKAEIIKEYGDIPQVQCMPSQINQVFMNLIVNAAHAIEKRGIITIRSGNSDNKVWISVSDNGKGMPEDVKNRIFEPFFTTKPVGEGTGLGLSLSYGIIENHGGSINVESEPDKGTCFTVVLPVQQIQKQEPQTGTSG